MDLIEHKKIGTGFQRHPWEQTRVRILLFWLTELHIERKLLIDVGSGDAYPALQAAAAFPQLQVAAIDPNYESAFLSDRDNDPSNLLLLHSLDQLNASDTGPAAAIVLMDVLEHVEDPSALLRQLKESGFSDARTRFLITVPAFQRLYSNHDRELGHFRRYSRRQMKGLLRSAGFAIQESGYFFFSLLLVRLLQKLGWQSNAGVHNWKGGQRRTRLLAALLWADFRLCQFFSRLGLPLPGLSCYCLCHPL